MNNPTLTQMKQRYPAALYSFMRITHPLEAMERFLAEPTQNPVFSYPKALTAQRAEHYLEKLQVELTTSQDKPVRGFLNYRITEATLLGAFIAHRSGNITPSQLQAYRKNMEALYGPIRVDYFDGALTYLERLATEKGHAATLKVLSTVTYRKVQLPAPDTALFTRYRTFMQHHVPEVFTKIPAGIPTETAITQALHDSGLWARGWRTRTMSHRTNVATGRHRKRISIGSDYRAASPFRLQQIIAHEVYGHARRSEVGGLNSSPREEEGIAIVYEQLLARRFMYKRMLRFVALGLAWGVDGTPRDFVTTYRLMVPLSGLATGKTDVEVEQIAFKETLRAFRGGNPAVPGMILLKDKLYFESNLQVWQYLADKRLDAAAFGRLVDGYDVIPKEELA